VHREMQIWLAHTRYQMQGIDNVPVWRMTNTSLTVAVGHGLGAFYGLRKLRPSWGFPMNIIPAAILFPMTYWAAQVVQLPGMYVTLLSLPTPLGVKGREVLAALRNGGLLPSQEFGTKLPPRGGEQGSAPASVDAPASPSAIPSSPSTDDGSLAAASTSPELSQDAAPGALPAAADQDPWAANTPASAGPVPAWDSSSWEDQSPSAAPSEPSRPAPTSWEEIRARNAAAAKSS